ncbi:MAG TPA: amino acid ABC transporter permease [Candidatus Limnocylindrales bacterium]|jgi:polar amino acid transport system permease protein|nr:amino acid ABC transporter permease [Candidatus Limnocylindrales bacterium]
MTSFLKRLFLDLPEKNGRCATWQRIVGAWVPALFLLGVVFYFSFHQLAYQWNWGLVYRYRWNLFSGWLVTIGISMASLLLSLLIGLVFALARRSHLLPLRSFGHLYVELVRGTPLLVQILIFFYVVADAFHVQNRYVAGVLILSCFSGAYISEVIRAGIESVGESQIESARAIGLTRAQMYRFVIFPQALRVSLPPLVGQLVSLIKDSSLLSIIAVNEFTQTARDVNSVTYSTLECYLPLAAGYLLLTLPLSLFLRRLEQQLRFET